MADISAIVMTYNSADYLVHTLPPLVFACREVVVLDMESTDATREVCSHILRGQDVLVSYARRNLFTFGFSHPRNYAAKFATSDWLLVVDSDELTETRQIAAFAPAPDGPAVFNVERRNYERREGLVLDAPAVLVAEAPFTTERHRRLFRRDPLIRFEGLIHEEVWEGAENAYNTCAPVDLTLHHLSAYGATDFEKHELYSYLLIKAQAFPGFRYGTNPWFFGHYVPENAEQFLASANTFAARHNLSTFEWGDLHLPRRAVAAPQG